MEPNDFRELLDAVSEAVVALDAEGRIAHLNRAALAFAGGRSAGEAVGRDWREVMPSFLHGAISSQLGAPAGGGAGRAVSGESAAPVEIEVRPLREGGKTVILRKAAPAVRTAPQLEALMESVPALVFIAHDPECRVITANPSGLELLRLSGGNISKSADDPSPVAHFRYMRGGVEVPSHELPNQLAARGIVLRGAELDLVFGDGAVRRIYGNAFPIRDAQGVVQGSIAAFVDITARSRAELEIRRLNEGLEGRVRHRTAALQEANMQLESFCYSVSHDLRAPLRTIVGMTELLLQERPDDPAQIEEYLRRIHRAGRRMDTLIQDLLLYSRVNSADLRLAEIDLGQMLRTLLDDLAYEHGQSGTAIRNQVPPQGLRVRAYPVALQQVLVNLLGNAVKFVAPGQAPRIRIDAGEEGGWVQCRIADNGIGVPEEHRERIFNLFERLHPEGAYSGTGMGLSIARRAVERMGGRIGCRSNPEGAGTVFWIELPPAGPDGKG